MMPKRTKQFFTPNTRLLWVMVAVLFFCHNAIYSQPKADTVKKIIVPKKLEAQFGPYTISNVPLIDVKRLIQLNLPVKVKDSTGKVYTVISFEIIWKRKDNSYDVSTGKKKTVFYTVGGDIKTNQLPESWRNELFNFVQKGETIGINNIVYYDPKRKANFFANDIAISVL